MALSVYVHIPYCLQRCRYCDFTTFEQSEILPPQKYVGQVREEIRNRHHMWNIRDIHTLYFGGGTPSLVAPNLIVDICAELANVGFTRATSFEGTIEINPGTIDEAALNTYLEAGLNRFSVGAQTFDDALLTMCGRKHTAQDTRRTLKLLRKYDLNYSFDLLFALPGQTLEGLQRDLDEVATFEPPHVSAYCLTLPPGHAMSMGRPPEGEQVRMFEMIEESLAKLGINKYEISNFSKPGYESRHNSTHWNDSPYWGVGLSSHSYDPKTGPFGTRFWNPNSLKDFEKQVTVQALSWDDFLPNHQRERLREHESLTDFCHMHLRVLKGLPEAALRQKFQSGTLEKVFPRIRGLQENGLLRHENGAWSLTTHGQLISNKVFEELTFLAD
jgi:oxygen-independent coproporphyrinogen-3 oxidase